MVKIGRFVRRWWWAILAVTGAVFLVFWRLLAKKPELPVTLLTPHPTFVERAQDKVERIRLEGELEKARAASVAQARYAEIERIEDVGKTDPKEARKQLAQWLTRNL